MSSSIKYLNPLILLVIILTSCEELDVVNPADQSYELAAPTLVSVTPITDIQIDLVWKNNESNVKEFIVQRKSNSTQYTTIATVSEDGLSYSDTTCQLDTYYEYIVLSKVESNLSDYSNTISCFTSFPAPTEIAATPITEVSTHISWTDNSNFEDGFRVERDSGSGFEHVADMDANAIEYTDSGLTYGTEYTYRVAGFTDSNISNWIISDLTNTILNAPADLLTTAVSDTEIKVDWTDNCGNEVGFRIDREWFDEQTDYHSGFVSIAEVGVNVISYIDSDLSYDGSSSYVYRIASYTQDDLSSWVTSSPTMCKPWTPSDFIVTSISDSEVELVWSYPNSWTNSFILERDSGFGFIQIAELSNIDLNLGEVHYTDSGLSVNIEFIYRVASFDAQNRSDWATSNAISTTFPAPIGFLATEVSDSEIELNWTNSYSFEVGYRIDQDSGAGFIQIAEVNSDVTNLLVSGLVPETSYDYRVQAFTEVNQSAYSGIVSATTFNTAIDYDGNIYLTRQIGNQVWMIENLNVTHYRNGAAISNLADDGDWTSTSSGAFCYYNNDNSNSNTYGALYNWFSVSDSRNISPEGWHVPTDAEWKELETYIGLSWSEANSTGDRGSNEGGKLKESGAIHWNAPNTGATNETRFAALPGGSRGATIGYHIGLGHSGSFWSATESGSSFAWQRNMNHEKSTIGRNDTHKGFGFSIRCIKD